MRWRWLTVGGVVAAMAVGGTIAYVTSDGPAAKVPSVTEATYVPESFQNADGRPPKCYDNFDHTAELCNTSLAIVEMSQVAIDQGGQPAAQRMATAWRDACVSEGNSQVDCNQYAAAVIFGLIFYNLAHGLPQRVPS